MEPGEANGGGGMGRWCVWMGLVVKGGWGGGLTMGIGAVAGVNALDDN